VDQYARRPCRVVRCVHFQPVDAEVLQEVHMYAHVSSFSRIGTPAVMLKHGFVTPIVDR
jgi:hypothetical protein